MKRYRISARHFRQNRHLPKGPFAISFAFFYALAILAINRHFPQIRHFRQNRHFPKGPFVISFQFLFTVWRFWQLSTISAIFANACISGHISDEGETITGAAFGELRNHAMASVLSINPIYYESYNPFHVMSDQIQTLIDTEHITDETSKLENFLKQYFCCKI